LYTGISESNNVCEYSLLFWRFSQPFVASSFGILVLFGLNTSIPYGSPVSNDKNSGTIPLSFGYKVLIALNPIKDSQQKMVTLSLLNRSLIMDSKYKDQLIPLKAGSPGKIINDLY
jgi:hypothetical protein